MDIFCESGERTPGDRRRFVFDLLICLFVIGLLDCCLFVYGLLVCLFECGDRVLLGSGDRILVPAAAGGL